MTKTTKVVKLNKKKKQEDDLVLDPDDTPFLTLFQKKCTIEDSNQQSIIAYCCIPSFISYSHIPNIFEINQWYTVQLYWEPIYQVFDSIHIPLPIQWKHKPCYFNTENSLFEIKPNTECYGLFILTMFPPMISFDEEKQNIQKNIELPNNWLWIESYRNTFLFQLTNHPCKHIQWTHPIITSPWWETETIVWKEIQPVEKQLYKSKEKEKETHIEQMDCDLEHLQKEEKKEEEKKKLCVIKPKLQKSTSTNGVKTIPKKIKSM
jgi:hypothetical protein